MFKKTLLILSASFLIFGYIRIYADTDISAHSAIVIEKESVRVLYQKNPEKQLPIASTTKIMTAVIALENEDPAAYLNVSAAAANTEGSSMYLKEGERLSLEDLLYGLMLSSGNDAAVVIAEHFGGEEAFARLMNQKAAELGLENTHFTNPNGLPNAEHYSSAYDMAKLCAYALNNPKFAEIVSTRTYKTGTDGKSEKRTLVNHNKLLNICKGCIGVKTGFTKAAGRCLVSAVERDGMTLICVTLNAPDDWNDHCNLYASMFEKYKMRTLIHKGETCGDVEIAGAEADTVSYSAATDISYPLKKDEDCSISVELYAPLKAPAERGTECGKIHVYLNETEIANTSAVLSTDAKKKPIFKDISKNFGRNLSKLYKAWLLLLQG